MGTNPIDPADLIPPSGEDGAAAAAPDPFASWRDAGIDPEQLDPREVARTLQFANSLLDETTREEALENAMRHWGMLQDAPATSPQQPRLPQPQVGDDWSNYDDTLGQPPAGLTEERVQEMLEQRLTEQQRQFDERLAIDQLRRNVEGQMSALKQTEGLTDTEHQFLATRVAERLNTQINAMSQEQINGVVRSTWDDLMSFANARMVKQVEKTEQAPRTTTPRGETPAGGDGAGWGLKGALARTANQLGVSLDD